jgi:hypothetical protein
MTIEEINELKLSDNLDMILDRILDYSVLEEGEAAYSLDEDESMDLYDRIYMNKKIILPPADRIQGEWDQYIAELVAIELDRLQAVADAEAAAEAAVEQANKFGSMVVPLCHSIISTVATSNIINELTTQQKDMQASTYGDLFTALTTYRPGRFKSLLDAIEPDGTLVTQKLKDDILEILANNGVV